MKKSLRNGPAPKSYAQVEDDIQPNPNNDKKLKDRQLSRQSIFEHKNWSTKQKIKLMIFLSYYQGLNDWTSQRKSIHLYKHLSNYLKRNRTPEQCKNIHSLLKRKFSNMNDILAQMQEELQGEENYEKLLIKYEKEIDQFEKNNQLLGPSLGDKPHQYEPLSSKRISQRQDVFPHHQQKEMFYFREQIPFYGNMMQQQVRGVVKQEEGGSSFEQRRAELIDRCNFHYRQWLLLTTILEQRRKSRQLQDGTN